MFDCQFEYAITFVYKNCPSQVGLYLSPQADRLALRIYCHGPPYEVGEGNGNPLQYSCLENPMDRGACEAAVHGVAKSWTRLSDFTIWEGFLFIPISAKGPLASVKELVSIHDGITKI